MQRAATKHWRCLPRLRKTRSRSVRSSHSPRIDIGQGGQVLTLGAYVHEPAGDSLVKAVGDELLLWVAVAVPLQVPFSEIGEFASFLDIKRADKRIDRVWLNNGPCNFMLADLPYHTVNDESHGASSLYHVAEASPVFNQKRACRR